MKECDTIRVLGIVFGQVCVRQCGRLREPKPEQRDQPQKLAPAAQHRGGRLRFKCDGTRAETSFRLSAKRTSPFKLAGASVQSTTSSRGVRIRGRNAGYTMFRSSVKSTSYPLHSPDSPLLPLPCLNVCHHISAALYFKAKVGRVAQSV
jgi:hypothetical protein